ncbi:MAG: hypothetical protein V4450_02765 [Bacteroidota bacterium]
MRLNFTLFFLLLISFTAHSQKITGIWRGYFSSSSAIARENAPVETYKYEIQIDQQSNNGLKGVTYSYKTTVFYGKAELNGIYTASSKSIILKEIKLVDLKITGKSEPCLMTCYLDYSKIGKLEVLQGTFISINAKDKGDCGSGKVYLERVTTSDFKKEDFLLRNKPEDTAKEISKLKASIKPGTTGSNSIIGSMAPVLKNSKDNARANPEPLAKAPIAKPKETAPKTNATKIMPPPVKKPGAKPAIITKNKPAVKGDKPLVVEVPVERIREEPIRSAKEEPASLPQTETQLRKVPPPKVLTERENRLVKTITTSEENIEILFYDYGVIDNDTISVYHNNVLEISHGRLSNTPIVLRFKCSKIDNRHEITVVAENLGDIPPNSALMIVKGGSSGRERHEVFLESNEQRNAKVIINYVPKE